MNEVDLDVVTTRELNQRLHALPADTDAREWHVTNPAGKHALLVGLDVPIDVTVDGPVGYYCGGMNKEARITIDGPCGKGLGENIVSGTIRVTGQAADAAGATGHGGLIVIEGDASARCGISMKGVDIVVGGSVGHMSAFMGQSGHLVVCGDADEGLGDSLYEAVIYVRGDVAGLGADCIEKEMTPAHVETLRDLLASAGMDIAPEDFRRYGSARKLYNFSVDHADGY